MSARLEAHGALWYDSPLYRLAWLCLPQAAVAVIASLVMSVGGGSSGNWAKPVGSDDAEAKYGALLDRAGKSGDRAAFDELTKAADAGDTTAKFYLATLYDPVWAPSYPTDPVTADAGKALQLYQPAADLGFAGGQRAMALLSLGTNYGQYDMKRGCKYGTALVNNPASAQVHTDNHYGALFLTALCYADDTSGVPRNPDKAAELYLTTVAAKYRPAVNALTANLDKVPTDVIAAIQRNLKGRGLYNGPTDGNASQDTVAALTALAGQGGGASQPATASSDAGANPNGATNSAGNGGTQGNTERLSDDALKALFQEAATSQDAADRLRGYADGGDGRAQVYYATLLSPNYKMDRSIATDARTAARYYERLAIAGNGPAAASAAFLYDIGYPELPRNPQKAAELVLRSLDLKDQDTVTSLEHDTWNEGFWAALQQQLAQRNLYSGDIVDHKNDRTMLAVHQLAGAEQ